MTYESKYAIGDEVYITTDKLKGTVRSVEFEGIDLKNGTYMPKYEVTWWQGNERKMEWFREHEIFGLVK